MMMMTIRIEQLQWDNETQCRHYFELLNILATSGYSKPLDWQRFQTVIEALAPHPYASAYLAYDAETNVPVGALTCYENFSTFYFAPVFNVHDLVVHPTARGKGVAKALMAHFETMARQEKAVKLTLEVQSTNKVALPFYLRLGFSPELIGVKLPPCNLFLEKILDYLPEELSTVQAVTPSMKEPVHHA
jgi:ribosomal protein S18 acetylase RimI-like enzyme